MKNIVYGIGKYYETYKKYIDGEIVAYVDKSIGVTMPDGRKTISLERVSDIEFDRIVICSPKYAEEMIQTIVALFPEYEEKISLLEDLLCVRNYLCAHKEEIQKNEKIVHELSAQRNYNRIYVLCPANTKTGGPELLHQLVYHLNRIGKDARITYVRASEKIVVNVPNEYRKYVEKKECIFEELIDDEENLVIIPETMGRYIEKINKAQIGFWWLSVDNFVKNSDNISLDILYDKVDFHLYQSEYAKDFLLSLGLEVERIYPLSDYLNEQYLIGDDYRNYFKKPIILYNPRKGYLYTRKIISQLQEYEVRPIKNMTHEEVFNLMKKSMVYIDFGSHPGKDRIPREAAMLGCCIITGKRGSAGNSIDVPIPNKYKFDEKTVNTSDILHVIRECIDSYDECRSDFEQYRQKILLEKNTFLQQIEDFFDSSNT